MSNAAITTPYPYDAQMSVIYKSMLFTADILNDLPDAIIATDSHFNITGLNPAAEIIYCGHSAEIIGQPFFDVVKFEIIGGTKEGAIAEIIEKGYWGGDVIYYNNDLKYHTNNQKLIFNSCCSAIKDGAGNIIAYTFINKNISEKIRQQEELAKAENKYQILIESLSEGVILMHASGTIGACNKRAAEILGFTPDELAGKAVASQHWKAIKTDGSEFGLDEFPAIITLNTGEEQNNVVMGIETPGGERVWLSVNSRPIFKEGFASPEAVVASFTEITDIKKANERYTYALKASSDAIWDMDVCKGTIYRSENFTTLTGYTKKEIVPSLDWFLHKIHPHDRERVSNNVNSCMQKKLTHWENEYQFMIADGSYKHLLDKAFAVYENGKLIRVIGGIQDMTESKRLEKKLLQEQVQKQRLINKATIQAQERERDRISRELHDNVNQLLMSAKLHIGAAKGAGEEQHNLLDKASEYLLMAVEEIRGLSKELNSNILANVGLQKSIDDIACGMMLSDKMKMKVDTDKEVIDMLVADQQLMLYRIIQEQTNNILKYAGCTEATISIHAKENNAALIISDNGKGFDKNAEHATGIGLINIFNRVNAYNGKVEIITSPGNGCTLNICFPIK